MTQGWLPLFSLTAAAIVPTQYIPSLGVEHSSPPSAKQRWHAGTAVYALLALGWALSTAEAASQSRIATGVACPLAWINLLPVFQVALCMIDACAITFASRIREHGIAAGSSPSSHLSTALGFSAAAIATCHLLFLIADAELYSSFALRLRDVGDLALDAGLAATAVQCAILLLGDFHPTTVALIVSEIGLFGDQFPVFHFEDSAVPARRSSIAQVVALAAAFATALWRFPAQQDARPQKIAHRRILAGHLCTVLLAAQLGFFLSNPWPGVPVAKVIDSLIADAKESRVSWQKDAGHNHYIKRVAMEYRRRYGLLPPPNFDKWLEFAVSKESAVIDSFDQIYNDMLPFWGVKPSVLRERTDEALRYQHLEMGGMSIRDGKVHQSPHIPGTHRWMMDTLQDMIEPFARWLPDMNLAVNLADECRVAVPFHDIEVATERALESTKRLLDSDLDGYVPRQEWVDGFPAQQQFQGSTASPHFTDRWQHQIFYDLVAPTCPPRSKARSGRWWDRSRACTHCAAYHSIITDSGQLLTNEKAAYDLCHQPDVAYIDGLIMSPSQMTSTTTLFPIFSQSRISGFTDILMPSPWHFAEKSAHVDDEDVPWDDKTNTLYWRGSSSDGFAGHGNWPGFLRSRFVHEAYRNVVEQRVDAAINVSFASNFSKCDPADCEAQMAAYKLWHTATTNGSEHPTKDTPAPPVLPFQENWKYKHLMDLSGAGFSGRFLPFLRSSSLVYRATLLRAWYDERLLPWHDYIPVDVRLGPGFWGLVSYLTGGAAPTSQETRGQQVAREIAQQGKEWAAKTLRKEDMQIYMFRLLLEYGRVMDDHREMLGYKDI